MSDRLQKETVFAVIYDVHFGDADPAGSEQYYGFFDSPETARAQYEQLRGSDAGYRDARLVRVVEEIPDLSAGGYVDASLDLASPRHPDPRCKACGELLGDADRAEVYLDPDTLRANAGGQDVLVDDIPESAFGPFLVHADPCSQVEDGGRKRYVLA